MSAFFFGFFYCLIPFLCPFLTRPADNWLTDASLSVAVCVKQAGLACKEVTHLYLKTLNFMV